MESNAGKKPGACCNDLSKTEEIMRTGPYEELRIEYNHWVGDLNFGPYRTLAMPPTDNQQPLLPSILDRLLDLEPDASSEPMWRGSYKLDELREHVRRDLEFLLNTRHGRYDLLEQGGELGISTLAYGIPDFSGSVGGGLDSIERVRVTIERAVRDYETRLRNVRVEVQKSEFEFDRNIHLLIHATLCVDPIVDLVTFDTNVESATGICEVRSS